MQNQESTWSLMAKCLFGEASAAEKAALEALLREHPSLQQQFDILSGIVSNRPSLYTEKTGSSSDDDVRRIINKATSVGNDEAIPAPAVKRFIRPRSLAIAASLIFLMIAGWWLSSRYSPVSGNKTVLKAALVAKNGTRNKTALPDGSVVWLNSGSRLFYVNNFKGATREVRLEGEGFFDIAKNAAKPFIVHAGDIDIKVLGTAFNVKAYAEDDNVETTLYRGLVNVSKANDEGFQPILLYPNQKLILPRKHVIATPQKASIASTPVNAIAIKQIDSNKIENTRIETAWMYNRLEFRGDDFVSLSRKLERWYNVKISFSDEEVQKLSFNGSFEKENVEQALLALKTANSFNYKIKNDEIIISTSR